jgi:Ca2+-binding EF-hand superfamily protein
MEPPTTFTDDEIRVAFQTFDLDKNMYIGVSELKHILTIMGETATEEEIDEMIRICDPDGAGQVTFDGFYRQFAGPATESQIERGSLYSDRSQRDDPHGSANDEDGLPNNLHDLMIQFISDKRITPSFVRRIYKRFQAADKDQTGRIGYPDFIAVMESNNSGLLRKIFDMCDLMLYNEIEIKPFIINLILHSFNISKIDKIRISFSVMKSDSDSLSYPQFYDLMSIFFNGSDVDVSDRVEEVLNRFGFNPPFDNVSILFDHLINLIQSFPALVLPPFFSEYPDDIDTAVTTGDSSPRSSVPGSAREPRRETHSLNQRVILRDGSRPQ